MTYYGGTRMAASFRQVRANTIRVAQEIAEERYDFKPTPESRSVAQLLAHVANGPRFQLLVHGQRIDDLKQVNFGELLQQNAVEEARTRSKIELLELLTSEGERFATFLEGVSDAFLAEPVAMPPGADPTSKSRFEMLLSAKEHEMHHRGQLMLTQRLLGLTPHLTREAQARMAARAVAAAAPAAR